MAQQIAISPQAVGKWERGESLPDISTLIRLAELVGVDLNYFSDKFPSKEIEETNETIKIKEEDSKNPHWNMSQGNWENLDFSGLKIFKRNSIHRMCGTANLLMPTFQN